MRFLLDPTDLEGVEDAYISTLLLRRFREIRQEGRTYEELGMFLLIETGDTASDIEQTAGIWITSALFGDARYGDADFAPCFEALEVHPGHGWELVYILDDNGYAVTIIVPEQIGIDDELLRFCREYGTTAAISAPA
ncbi:MAG: hypothetical protein RLZZ298_1725 [Pseudomonadota bacterium]|jgi:hypothetical protein